MPPDENDPLSEPVPEFKHLDAEAFEDEWRNWLDNPPVDWAPPKDATRVLTQTLDMRQQGNFIMRFDAWVGDEGIHSHARVVMLAPVPATVITLGYVRMRKPWWAIWKKREWVLVEDREDVIDRRIISKHVVGSFVIPWGAWNMMQDIRLDPNFPTKPNGKGGDPDPEVPYRGKREE